MTNYFLQKGANYYLLFTLLRGRVVVRKISRKQLTKQCRGDGHQQKGNDNAPALSDLLCMAFRY